MSKPAQHDRVLFQGFGWHQGGRSGRAPKAELALQWGGLRAAFPGVWMNCLTPDSQRAFPASQGLPSSTGLVNRDHSSSLWHSWLLEKSEDLAIWSFIPRRLPAVSDRAVGLPASGSATWGVVVTCLQVNEKKECLPRSTCMDMLG